MIKPGEIVRYKAAVRSGYYAPDSTWQKYRGTDGQYNRKIFRKECSGEGLYLGKSKLLIGHVLRYSQYQHEFIIDDSVSVLAIQDISTQNYRKPFYVLQQDLEFG